MNIWVGKDTNHKPIIKLNYPKLHVGDLVLRAPQPPKRGAAIYGRMFDIDPNIYVVARVVGDKYNITNIANVVMSSVGIVVTDNKLYQPYELRNITNNWREVADSQLYRLYITKEYNSKMYDRILNYLSEHYG